LTLETRPVKIIDCGEKILRNKRIPLVRVLWRNLQIEEETWGRESEIKEKHPTYSSREVCSLNFKDEIFVRRGECETQEQIIQKKGIYNN